MYTPKPNIQWAQVPIWVRASFAFLVLDAASYYVASLSIGGDAARGFRQEGKYYLTGGRSAVEVRRATYYYSYLHLISMAPALFVAVIGARRVQKGIRAQKES